MLAIFLTFLVYPSCYWADISKKLCILLSRILHREPINLTPCIIDEMIVQGYPSMPKNEVLPYGILIIKSCQRVKDEFPINFSFLKSMGPIDTSSWNQSQGQIDGALGSRKKVYRRRAKIQIGEGDSNSTIGSNVLAERYARFNALDENFFAQSTLLSEQISQLQSHMERLLTN